MQELLVDLVWAFLLTILIASAGVTVALMLANWWLGRFEGGGEQDSKKEDSDAGTEL